VKLIVGLGNPGIEYQYSPHNLGFEVVDCIANDCEVEVRNRQCQAITARAEIGSEHVLLVKPTTFMNLSGTAVRELAERYEIKVETDLIVIYDELDLPLGTIRIRERGSSAGHNGMKSIIGALGTMDFPRVRLGVQPEYPVDDLADYVLRPMRRAVLESAAEMVDAAAEAVQVILADGVGRAMTRFNRRVAPPDEDL